ncbi:MAG: 4-hydroxy-3-methylbut-2-enyl diphosphate reductase [Ferrimicrobium sp.]
MQVERVLIATPHGFCAGVEKAIKALAWMTRIFAPPIYCYHEIVHNHHVVASFGRAGVIFVDDIAKVPAGSPLMLSAHGSAPEVIAAAVASGGVVIDAVCPLVTKVHHEIRSRASRGYTILYIGHRGHEEAVGATSEAPDAVHLIETEQDLARVPPIDGPVALLAQTTLAVPEWESLANSARLRYPELWTPGRSDLCYATTNRQAALTAVAPLVDAMVVLGSANSSNTRALERVAIERGVPIVVRINDASELPDYLAGTVGVTAGASASEDLVTAVVEALHPTIGVELVTTADEEEYFPPPPELRDLLGGLTAALELILGTSDEAGLLLDRDEGARDALSRLG